MPLIHIHRSGYETARKCLREYYLSYHAYGTGISPKPVPIYFIIGNAVHEGLACSMRKLTQEQAVQATLDYLASKATEGHQLEVFAEACRLCEALIRSWYLNGHEQFHAMYDVLAIEEDVVKHEIVWLSPTQFVEVVWSSRPDAIVKSKYTPEVVGISWKTIDDASEYRRSKFATDLQGLTEQYFGTLALANMLEWQEYKVTAIQTIFLQKGKRLKPRGGLWAMEEGFGEFNEGPFAGIGTSQMQNEASASTFQLHGTDTFLTKRYVHDPYSSNYLPPWDGKEELAHLHPSYAWQYRYFRPGLKSYNELSGFIRQPIPQAEIAPWIHALSQNQIFPTPEYNNGETALDKAIIWQDPIMRNDELAESVIREMRWEMARIGIALDQFQFAPKTQQAYMALLEKHFPRSIGEACLSKTRCPYIDACYNPDRMYDLFTVPDKFQRRNPHHEAERKYLTDVLGRDSKTNS